MGGVGVVNYYNDNDKFSAQWLRNLVAAGLIPPGDVDDRSILDVRAGDLAGYKQCHFFAGIGGWPYALSLAGWEGECWTGSAPCQPFSAAGSQDGAADERHLWPAWFALIRECRPEYIFGEQVSAAIRLGWLDGVFTDLEREGYTTGAAVLGAHSVGAPHIRQRLYWVADARSERRQQESRSAPGDERAHGWEQDGDNEPSSAGAAERLADTSNERHERGGGTRRGWQGLADDGAIERVADDDHDGPQGRDERGHCPGERSAWAASVVIECGDGKRRRIPFEPALQPLAPGLSGRVGLLRGSGNAIVPPLAAEFIRAFLEVG